jgi:hypothetical protein
LKTALTKHPQMAQITQMTTLPRVRRYLRILFVVLLPCCRDEPVTTTPERSLGEPAGRFAQPFTRISGLRELADGRVIVADQSEKRVVLLDSAWSAARTIARQGQGPLEYSFPAAVIAYPGDSTLISDLLQRRLLLLDPAGDPIRTINLPPSLGFGAELFPIPHIWGADRRTRRPCSDGTWRPAGLTPWPPWDFRDRKAEHREATSS